MFCGLCRPQRDPGGGLPEALPTEGSHVPPAQPLMMLRSKSAQRILVESPEKGLLAASGGGRAGGKALPSAALAQASRRRVDLAEQQAAAEAAGEQAAKDAELVRSFVNCYTTAITSQDHNWASQVESMFTDDARMVSTDKQSFHGRPAILRRLNNGVEQLSKMAGEQAALPTFKLEGPMPDPAGGGVLVMLMTFKRGLQRMTFTLQFTMQAGKIAVLRNTRS